MKQADLSRLNRLIGELEEFLSERGATVLEGTVTVAPNDYGLVGAAVRIELVRPENAPS
jgi:hypothetical protein